MVVTADRLITDQLADELTKYRGQWVALDQGRIVAAAADPAELFRKMDDVGARDATVHHVPEDPQAVFIL